MDLVCVQTVPADGITALFIQGRMIELDTVCVCVCCCCCCCWSNTDISADMEADT